MAHGWFFRDRTPVPAGVFVASAKAGFGTVISVGACLHCDGAGSACGRCGGTGACEPGAEQVFSAEVLEKFGAALEAAAKAEAAKPEKAAKAESEPEAPHMELIDSARPLVDENDFAAKMLALFDARQKLTGNQIAALGRVVGFAAKKAAGKAARAAEAAEKAETAQWVGVVGARVTLKLTVARVIDVSGFSYGRFRERSIFVCDDESGNRVVYIGSAAAMPKEAGESVKIQATIKDHAVRDGLKQTVISYPSAAA